VALDISIAVIVSGFSPHEQVSVRTRTPPRVLMQATTTTTFLDKRVYVNNGKYNGRDDGVVSNETAKTVRVTFPDGFVTGNLKLESVELLEETDVPSSPPSAAASLQLSRDSPRSCKEEELPTVVPLWQHDLLQCKILSNLAKHEATVIEECKINKRPIPQTIITTEQVMAKLHVIAGDIVYDGEEFRAHPLRAYMAPATNSSKDKEEPKCRLKVNAHGSSLCHVDHVLPLAWGGRNALHNFVILPASLNMSFGDTLSPEKKTLLVECGRANKRNAWQEAQKFARAM
jgi:hypothetical protein